MKDIFKSSRKLCKTIFKVHSLFVWLWLGSSGHPCYVWNVQLSAFSLLLLENWDTLLQNQLGRITYLVNRVFIVSIVSGVLIWRQILATGGMKWDLQSAWLWSWHTNRRLRYTFRVVCCHFEQRISHGWSTCDSICTQATTSSSEVGSRIKALLAHLMEKESLLCYEYWENDKFLLTPDVTFLQNDETTLQSMGSSCTFATSAVPIAVTS